jgi:hypothetical protein
MPSSLLHFAAWWLLLAALPLIWAVRAHSPMRRDERVFRLMLIVSPLLMAAIWLHGLAFEPARNWAQAEPLLFFAVWFRPHAATFYAEHAPVLLAVAAPVIVIAGWLAYRGTRLIDYAWNRRTAAISFALQIAGWLLLRPLAAVLVEIGDAARTQAVAAALAANTSELVLALVPPLPVIAVALMFSRLSIEAAARRSPGRSSSRPHAARSEAALRATPRRAEPRRA